MIRRYLFLFLALFACHRAPSHSVGSTVIQPATTAGSLTLGGDVTGSGSSTVVSSISGSSPINVTPSSLKWTAANAPAITQATALSDVATGNISLTPQAPFASAVTHLLGGNVVVNIPTSVGGAIGYGALQIKTGATSIFYIQPYADGAADYGGFYAGAVTPGGTNYLLLSDTAGTTAILNASTTDSLRIANVHVLDVTSGAVAIAGSIGGNGSTPLSLAATVSAIACGTGGTQTITAAQSITPGLTVTSGTLSSNCVLAFGTNASNGWYQLDMSGVTLGASFGVQFTNGSASSTVITSANVLAGATLAHVWTHGANTLAVQY